MHHIWMNIHGLYKLMDMYGYGCEVTDIYGYIDVTHLLPAAKVVQIAIYTDKGLTTSFVKRISQATGTGGDIQVACLWHIVTSLSHRLILPSSDSRL